MNRRRYGFTVVEMTVAIALIGFLGGTVTKGREVVNSFRQKSFYTGFVRSWELGVIDYYDRAGRLLADGDHENRGRFTDFNLEKVRHQLHKVGLKLPESNTETANIARISGAFSGMKNVTLTPKSSDALGNYFQLDGLPPDVAAGLDTIAWPAAEAAPVNAVYRIKII